MLGALLLQPDGVERLNGSIASVDFDLPRHRAVFAAIVALHARGEPPSLVLIRRELEERGVLADIGDMQFLIDLLNETPTAAHLEAHARAVREAAEQRRLALGLDALAARANGGAPSEEVLEGIDALRAQAKPHTGRGTLARSILEGDSMRALLEGEDPISPLPGILDPSPHLHVIVGKPKTAKTTFALLLAQAWSECSPPWEGARPLPGGRVLVVSREQDARRLGQTLRRLAQHNGRSASETWQNNISVLARHNALGRDGAKLLCLDASGMSELRAGLSAARDAGRPYSLVVLDSLSRLKPPEIEERDNDGISAWLDGLEQLSADFGCYVLLIHHVGHTGSDNGRGEARSAGRGASAIGAVAQVTMLVERVPGDPRKRVLKVDGNAVMTSELYFEVAPEGSDPTAIFYFRPCALTSGLRLEELFEEPEEITKSELARRIAAAGDEGAPKDGHPSGASLRAAAKLIADYKHRLYIAGGEGRPLRIRWRPRESVPPANGHGHGNGHDPDTVSLDNYEPPDSPVYLDDAELTQDQLPDEDEPPF